MVNFQGNREIRILEMQAPEGYWNRAQKVIRNASSDDGKTWRLQTASQIRCQPNTAKMNLCSAAKARYLGIGILQNCGDANYVSIRGLRFE